MTDYPRPSAGVATPPRQPWVPPAAYQQPSAMPWITHFDPDPPARGSSFVRGVLGGIIVCLLLGSAGWFAVRPYIWPNSSIPFSSPLGLPSGGIEPGGIATGLAHFRSTKRCKHNESSAAGPGSIRRLSGSSPAG